MKSFIVTKFIVFAVLFLISLTLLPTTPAQAHCTPYHPHHCIPTPKPEVIDRRTRGFFLQNNSNNTVYVAYGWHVPYSSKSGDLTVVTEEQWRARGWWSVNPHAGRWIYKSNSTGTMYFRITSRGNTLIPRDYLDSAQFCISERDAFYSSETVKYKKFVLDYDKQNGVYQRHGRGTTCSQAQGEWQTFYRMKIRTTFTVN